MNDSTSEILYALNSRLEGEISKLDRSRSVTFSIGLLLLCIVGAYFYCLTSMMIPYSNARNLANIAALEISKTVPGIIASSKETITQRLPYLLSCIKTELYRGMRSLRVRGNAHLIDSTQALFKQVDELLKQEIRKEGSPYRKKIAEKLKVLSDSTQAQKELEGLDIVLESVIFDEIDNELNLGLTHLQKIESQITQALSKDADSEQDRLIKKFITYWVNFYAHSFQIR